MDFSKEVKQQFNLEDEISSGVIEKEQPKKKIISQEEINSLIGQMTEQLEESEELIKEQGFDHDSVILIYQALNDFFSDRLQKIKSGPGTKAPGSNGSAAPDAEEKNQEKQPGIDPLDLIYNFEVYPPLTCKFIGPGKDVTVEGRPLKTWEVEATDTEKTKWLIPRWTIFSEVQGSFLGFQAEQPGKYIYQLTYKGVQQLQPSGIKFMVEILKKFPG